MHVVALVRCDEVEARDAWLAKIRREPARILVGAVQYALPFDGGDHLSAVTTLVAETAIPRRSAPLGAGWASATPSRSSSSVRGCC